MWCAESSFADQFPDVGRFLNLLNASTDFFEPGTPLYLARAPGRLDLMGGIADYSGSLVLQMPLAVATLVAVQQTASSFVTILSTIAAEIGSTPLVTLPLEMLYPADGPLDYASAHRLLAADAQQAWAAYVAGVLVVLRRELRLVLPRGVRILVHCEVPVGKGVSSSAALEVATMQALCALLGYSLDGHDLALLCQKVENFVVGAPCGIMDQMASACGLQNNLLAILCQPAQLVGSVPLPSEIEVWGIDSGVRHAVTGSDYSTVRIGAFMGYRIIAEETGLKVIQREARHVEIADPFWGGYLANLSPSLWETAYRDQVPGELGGKAFLNRYGGSTDAVTEIDPERTYALRQPTAHPIYEHQRVRLFRALLEHCPVSEEHLALLGELMYQSHASYSACGLGSKGTDLLVAMIRRAGASAGLYGAKITGGGSGGTVAVLARCGVQARVEEIVARYEDETGQRASLLSGSSSGAVAWGVMRLVEGE